METVLICASLIFALLAGGAIGCLMMARTKPQTKPVSNGIRIWRPSRQRRESLKRATHNARLFVAGGSIDIPNRRRA